MAENGRLHVTPEIRSDAFQGRTQGDASHKRGQAGARVIKQRLPATAVGEYPARWPQALHLPLHQRSGGRNAQQLAAGNKGPTPVNAAAPTALSRAAAHPCCGNAPHSQKLLRGASVLARTSAATKKAQAAIPRPQYPPPRLDTAPPPPTLPPRWPRLHVYCPPRLRSHPVLLCAPSPRCRCQTLQPGSLRPSPRPGPKALEGASLVILRLQEQHPLRHELQLRQPLLQRVRPIYPAGGGGHAGLLCWCGACGGWGFWEGRSGAGRLG